MIILNGVKKEKKKKRETPLRFYIPDWPRKIHIFISSHAKLPSGIEALRASKCRLKRGCCSTLTLSPARPLSTRRGFQRGFLNRLTHFEPKRIHRGVIKAAGRLPDTFQPKLNSKNDGRKSRNAANNSYLAPTCLPKPGPLPPSLLTGINITINVSGPSNTIRYLAARLGLVKRLLTRLDSSFELAILSPTTSANDVLLSKQTTRHWLVYGMKVGWERKKKEEGEGKRKKEGKRGNKEGKADRRKGENEKERGKTRTGGGKTTIEVGSKEDG